MELENPYAPPKAELHESPRQPERTDGWRDGSMLVVPKGAELPDRCLKCNAPAQGYRFVRNLSWLNPLWFVLFLMSPLIYIIVYFILRKRGRVAAGLCQRHRKLRRRAIAIGWLTELAGIAVILIPLAFSTWNPTIPVIGGIVLLLVGFVGGRIGAQVLIPKRINKEFIWLDKVSRELLAEYPAWPA